MDLRKLKYELSTLLYLESSPEVIAARELVRQQRAVRVKELQDKINALQSKRPAKKPRWPDNTPANVIEFCKEYWRGTTELHTFRIHCWTSKSVWTSYPSGGYSDNSGWNPTPVCFRLVSRVENDGHRSKLIQTLDGRQSLKHLASLLE